MIHGSFLQTQYEAGEDQALSSTSVYNSLFLSFKMIGVG
jgi:hypothetical protein